MIGNISNHDAKIATNTGSKSTRVISITGSITVDHLHTSLVYVKLPFIVRGNGDRS